MPFMQIYMYISLFVYFFTVFLSQYNSTQYSWWLVFNALFVWIINYKNVRKHEAEDF